MNPLSHQILPPQKPRETGTSKSWEKVEARLGLPLPPDYKAFVDLYGTGSFDEFLFVYNPFAQNEYLNLFYALDTLHQAGQQTRMTGVPRWSAVRPFDLYPAADGLLPWGCTANLGETLFWRIKGAPETWETIFYNLRLGEYEVWKYPVTEFLYLLLMGRIESVLLPVDFPPTGSQVTFIPV